VVIEPWLTDQWFVDAATLAKPAIEAVETGRTRFVPKHWENTYFEWMKNIQPWCISRQIWWGHQVPAWYGPDGAVFVELSEAAAADAAVRHYGHAVELTRDSDVLDTWFSSGLWPFSTLGWPEKTPELARYYPTDVLVTGLDIIFFWVARMMMMGLHFMGDVPFREVYIHALVRDEKGQKMSKSKGNVIDPLGLVDAFGCDALRFTLAALAAQGREIRMSESRVEGYRNFVTKLWNAARFCEMNGCAPVADFHPAQAKERVNRWIASSVSRLGAEVAEAIAAYGFNQAASLLYGFVWNSFCDWFVEFAKPILQGADEAAKAETRATAAWVMQQILHFLHPFMPFVTEELWEQFGSAPDMLVRRAWPTPNFADAEASSEMEWLIRLIAAVRTARGEMNVPPSARLSLLVKGASAETQRRLATHRDIIHALARVGSVEIAEDAAAKGALQVVVDEATVLLPVGDVIDLAQERARLDKDRAKLDGEIGKIDAKLANPAFVAKARPEVVDEQRERRDGLAEARSRLTEALARLDLA
jgi:valyl-tRNA synthetase